MKSVLLILCLSIVLSGCTRRTSEGSKEVHNLRLAEAQRLDLLFEERVGMPVAAEGSTLLIAVPSADTMSRVEFTCALQEVGFKDNLFKEVQIAVLDAATRTKDVKAQIPLPLHMSASECDRVKDASRNRHR